MSGGGLCGILYQSNGRNKNITNDQETLTMDRVNLFKQIIPFLASDAGSELYISTNEKPETKTMVSYVDGGFATYQYEYDR